MTKVGGVRMFCIGVLKNEEKFYGGPEMCINSTKWDQALSKMKKISKWVKTKFCIGFKNQIIILYKCIFYRRGDWKKMYGGLKNKNGYEGLKFQIDSLTLTSPERAN